MGNNSSANPSLAAKRARATKNLQIALQGESPEHINRVLSLVIKFNIDPDEEFFLLIAAIGHLKVLVEDAPQDWQNLFKIFTEELEQWAELNTEHLKILASKTETIENLALSCEKLGNTLELLEAVSQEQTVQLKGLISLSTELKNLRQELREIKGFQDNTLHSISTRSWISIWVDRLGWGIVGAFLLATILNTVVSWQATNLSQETQTQIDWAMTKLGRIEKKLGITSK